MTSQELLDFLAETFSGCQLYLVGGSLRDQLLGREAKDLDIATDARPG
jgi:tRNA nucleotidyltransferase/poly(A) polymerase